MERDLTCRSAVVTGASWGIGRSIAKQVAAHGAYLALPVTVFDDLTTANDPEAEDIGVITKAALHLCSFSCEFDRSADLLAELARSGV